MFFSKLITQKFLNLIESISDGQVVKKRYIFEDLPFSFPFERNDSLVQLECCRNVILSSIKPLSPISNELTDNYDLPDISPIDPLITFNKEHIYKINDIYRKYFNVYLIYINIYLCTNLYYINLHK